MDADLTFLISLSLPGQPAAEELQVGFLASAFAGVDLRDARVATEVWLEQFAGKRGLDYRPRSFIFDDLASAVRAVQNGNIEIMNLATLDYLEVQQTPILEPAMVGITLNGSMNNEYVLLVHGEAGITSLDALQDKHIRIDSRGRIAALWLDVLLLRQGLPEGRVFFADFMKVDRVSRAVLPVFFKQADACIVTRYAFDTMVKLNPQLGRVLKALAHSPGFLRGIMCFASTYDPVDKATINGSALELHTEPEGHQVLTLLGLKQVLPYQPDYLDGTLALLREYRRLKSSGEKNP